MACNESSEFANNYFLCVLTRSSFYCRFMEIPAAEQSEQSLNVFMNLWEDFTHEGWGVEGRRRRREKALSFQSDIINGCGSPSLLLILL